MPNTRTARRRRTRWKAFLISCVLLAVLASTIRCYLAAPRGFVVEMRAVDADTAVLLWSASFEDGPSRGWISQIDAEGHTRWWRELPDVPLGSQALEIVGDVVVVRFAHRTDEDPGGADHSLVAYSIDSGELLWERVLRVKEPGGFAPSTRLYVPSIAASGTLVEWAGDGESWFAFGIDPAIGSLRWQAAWSHERPDGAPLYIDGRVVLQEPGGSAVLDARHGSITQYDARGFGCIIGDEYVSLTETDGKQALIARRYGEREVRREIGGVFDPDERASLTSCGRYRDRIVLWLDRGKRTTVMVLDPLGHATRSIDVPRGLRFDGIYNRYPDRAPLAGELTRFAPYLSQGVAMPQLTVLDLETGAIAWQGPQDKQLLDAAVFRTGRHWYLSSPSKRMIAVFDGDTGRLDTAIHEDFRTFAAPSPTHIAGGRLWLLDSRWHRVDQPAVAVLDATTLTTLSNHDLALSAVTTEMRRYLGLRD